MSLISQSEYRKRRDLLMQQMEPNSIAILPAAPVSNRNNSVDYPFRQNSDFYYLAGFNEPEAVIALIPGREHGEFVMFCRERNPERELWDGLRAGQEGAMADYGADDAFPIADIDEILPGLIEGRERIYYSVGKNHSFDQQLMDWVNSIRSKARLGAQPPKEFVMLDHLLHEMRLFKSAAETSIMQHAAEISCRAHVRAMQAVRPGMFEYQLEAELDYEFRKSGARLPAYNSIVAAGANACILHYVENNARIRDGDLILIDAGCELDCYASDITRTFPASGRFSAEQRAIHDLVLRANLAAIDAVAPGRHWNEPHDITVQIITAGLLELGLLEGDLQQLIDSGAYRDFYMHRAGHWLGMDVHDVGDYKVAGKWRLLEPGMVMTIEPGIYIAADNHKVDKKWRGIGVRIEDNVLVTKTGNRVLTTGVPKAAADIEQLMQQAGDRQ